MEYLNQGGTKGWQAERSSHEITGILQMLRESINWNTSSWDNFQITPDVIVAAGRRNRLNKKPNTHWSITFRTNPGKVIYRKHSSQHFWSLTLLCWSKWGQTWFCYVVNWPGSNYLCVQTSQPWNEKHFFLLLPLKQAKSFSSAGQEHHSRKQLQAALW